MLSYCSTLGFEALTWGKKVFFFYMPEERNYRLDNPRSEFFQIRNGDFEEFCRKMKFLLEMPLKAYQAEVAEDAKYVIANTPPGAHRILREKIEASLRI